MDDKMAKMTDPEPFCTEAWCITLHTPDLF